MEEPQQQQLQQVDDCVIANDDTWREDGEDESAQPQQQHQLEGIVEAPCYYPTAEQFEEPLKYIASIRPEAESYGVCRICPPLGWKPPFAHRPDKLRFATKEQDLVRERERASWGIGSCGTRVSWGFTVLCFSCERFWYRCMCTSSSLSRVAYKGLLLLSFVCDVDLG